MQKSFDHIFSPEELSLLNASILNFEGKVGIRRMDISVQRRDGLRADFLPFQDVEKKFEQYSKLWIQNFSNANTEFEIASACAHFWYTFILIHPFENGNGRTAKKAIEQTLEKLNYSFAGFYLIDRYLFTGNIQEDLFELQNLFTASISNFSINKEHHEVHHI